MLSQWERYAFVYDLLLKPHPDTAPLIDLQEVLEHLAARQQRGECVKLINRESAAIRIQALTLDEDQALATFLINYADKDTVDPVFGNLETGELRLEPKLDGEGVAVSAHMVVSLIPSRDRAYPVVLEDIPGVGRTKITAFLNTEFKAVCDDYLFRDVDGKVRKYRARPELVGHPSEKLSEGLREGSLKHIELVRPRLDGGGFDEPNVLREEKRTIGLKVQGNVIGDAAVALLNRVRRRAHDQGFVNMKVRFKGAHSTKLVDVPTAREDAGDIEYVRYEHLGRFENPMLQCTETPREDMVEKLRDLLIQVRAEQQENQDA